MIKRIALASAILIFAGPAVSGNCPSLFNTIDANLGSGKAVTAEEIKKRRGKGEALHESVSVLQA